MSDAFRYADSLGPEQILHLHDPASGLRAIVVVDNTACGPAIGGTRMAPDVSLEECARLARAMTLKNAAASLPHGGAKAVIFGDPKMPDAHKETLIRAYAFALKDVRAYIPGPDMGTDERAMAWVRDVAGRAVGLPREVGGIPLDEIGATGFGAAIALEAAQKHGDFRIAGARVAVQGFGAVGIHAARFLAARGALLVAAADSRGTIANAAGLDIEALAAWKRAGNALTSFAGGTPGDTDAIVGVDCDVWIPAARPDVLREDNVDRLRARVVVQGANIPATAGAERRLAERGVLVLPDFIANAGGVICASVEYHGGSEAAALAAIEEKIRYNVDAVLTLSGAEQLLPRAAAVRLAESRVRRAMALRRRG